MKLKFFILASVFISGCATQNARYQVPVPQDHVKESQLQMQAVRHWEILAEDIAKQSVSELTNKNLNKDAISIIKPSDKTKFNSVLNELLITKLVNHGIQIKKQQDYKVNLEYNVQVVRFDSNRRNTLNGTFAPGMITLLAGGVSVLHLANTRWKDWETNLGILGSGVAVDAFNTNANQHDSNYEIPSVEVIVHSAIVKDGVYLTRRSDIYYVNDPDEELYSSATQTNTTLMDSIREYDQQINERRKGKGAY